MNKDTERMVNALQAIIARVRGDFDHPALVEYGALRGTLEDIFDIAKQGLGDVFEP